jgi:hypothetical protein
MAVRMELRRVLIRETNNHHIVELREVDGERIFPIVIGMCEAMAIERRLLGQTIARPQTHELLDNIIQKMGGRIERVIINDLQDHTFYARLIIRRGDETLDIDSRPSDAIALGSASDIPIYVEESVLEEVCPPGE